MKTQNSVQSTLYIQAFRIVFLRISFKFKLKKGLLKYDLLMVYLFYTYFVVVKESATIVCCKRSFPRNCILTTLNTSAELCSEASVPHRVQEWVTLI